jgi:hypothetical protein
MQMLISVSILLSVASFVVFVVFAALGFRIRARGPAAADMQLQAGLSDVTKLAEALARLAESLGKFAESLAKAGPAIAALVASIVFMLIAFAASGVTR